MCGEHTGRTEKPRRHGTPSADASGGAAVDAYDNYDGKDIDLDDDDRELVDSGTDLVDIDIDELRVPTQLSLF